MNQHFELMQCGKPDDLMSRVRYFDSHLDIDKNLKSLPLDHIVLAFAINKCVWPVALAHFGFASTHNCTYWCGRGCELAIEFFQQSRDDILMNSVRMPWYQCYIELYLLSCFCPQGISARTAASKFLQDDLQVEAAAIPIEPALGRIALLMASEYNDGLSQEVDIKNANPRWKKHAKSLFDAWSALKAGNRSQFTESMIKAVTEHARKTKDDENLPIFAVATLESAMLGRAYEKGWTDLEFPPEIAARLVTHQSLGVA
ncbi:MAG: hypothetical protein V4719_25680 [Planctomycetota bacterium]